MTRDPADESPDSLDELSVMKDSEGFGLIDKLLEKARPGRVLTKDDRKFFSERKLGDHSMNKQTIRDKRYRIRQRVKHSLMDFAILSHEQHGEDRKKVFQSLYQENPQVLKEVCVYLYLGFVDAGIAKKDFLVDVIRTAEKRRRGPDYDGEISTDLFGDDSPFKIEEDRVTISEDRS
mgnify:CR=1 FL=1